ncbi:hypothetical protein AB0D40_30325 [Streptomyces massasporeus]|uniref:hypothetical protein n=1 Tax=Streptomyces massasporeus TaxID=67324 RepID=UPI0033E31270
MSTVAGGVPRDLVQAQVYLSLLDVADPRQRVVVRLVLTATAAQFPCALGDFQDFVRTVRPDMNPDAETDTKGRADAGT